MADYTGQGWIGSWTHGPAQALTGGIWPTAWTGGGVQRFRGRSFQEPPPQQPAPVSRPARIGRGFGRQIFGG